jgi:hypothetical protein
MWCGGRGSSNPDATFHLAWSRDSYLAVWALLLDLPADAGGGAAGAGAHDDHVHVSAALGQDLLRRGVVVGQRVTRVPVLVQDDRVRDLYTTKQPAKALF